jgi:SagB-type dehydrogenase family enzyme
MARIANVPLETLGKLIFSTSISRKTPYEMLTRDYKEFHIAGHPVAVSQVTCMDSPVILERKDDLLSLIRDRRSARIYTGERMSLLQLSFLLWATQGIKKLRGKKYATLRTVPCGGARHEFETYLVVQNVEGLIPGAYHYLPMEHALERLRPMEETSDAINEALCGQTWAAKANVVFFWSMVPYRAEWRYGIYAHRIALIDAGHIGQNLYLACTGLSLGTCAIGAFSDPVCNALFELDGVEEYIVYTAPVGTVRECDTAQEAAFYAFVEEEGL